MMTVLVRRNNDQNLEAILSAIDADTKLAQSTRAQYKRAVRRAVEAGVNLTDAQALATYARAVSDSERAFLRASLGKLVDATRLQMNDNADPTGPIGEVAEREMRMAQASRKLDAVSAAIPTDSDDNGQRTHIWLSLSEIHALLESCDRSTLKGQRDYLALALMVGAGLRRKEASELRFSDVKRQGERTVLEVEGKGAKHRIVPISDRLAQAIAAWANTIGSDEGRVLRSVTRWGHVNGSVSTDALYNLTQAYGAEIGKPELQPHDLRRSYAQVGLDSGIPVHQISTLLGHASIRTTQKYLNLEINYDETISDYVPI